ncbi:hypothetical protein CEXT_770481 [Caerostris extrusa]|uniref:Uncharacterized protein n=1 Tax=Caerostris extrusa TaxID=172846 RepID=A0AAV4N026_CAEEX|nr:hypothetical protein CEXT_770481 [Caerostris extrusa]
MRANTLMKITNFARRQVCAKWPSNPTKPITWPDCRNKTPPLSSRAKKKIKRSLAHEKKHYWKRNLIISFNIFLPSSPLSEIVRKITLIRSFGERRDQNRRLE